MNKRMNKTMVPEVSTVLERRCDELPTVIYEAPASASLMLQRLDVCFGSRGHSPIRADEDGGYKVAITMSLKPMPMRICLPVWKSPMQ